MISLEFERQYEKLNKAQKEAVDTVEGPVMVIAGPGTGKTTILTLRIANILKLTDTPPSGILALTFTDAGVKAMRMKLRAIIGTRADEVRIHTFHGFAASVISEFQDHFPHLSRSKQITDIEAEALLREILKDKKFAKLRPLGEPDFYVNKILVAIGDSKQEAWTPAMIASFAKDEALRVRGDESSISTRGASKGGLKADAQKRIEKCDRTVLFAEVYNTYEDRKKDARKIDFDDLIFELLQALRHDKLLLQLLQEKFLYIHLDEHQDTNDSQNLIVKLIADFFESPNLFVVGDEKQAIYRFQGASVENFLNFQNTWKSMKVISLAQNYRSHQGILDASFSMIENNYVEGEHMDLRMKLNSENGEEPDRISIVTAGNKEAEEKYLVNELRAILQSDKMKKIAIIVRRNRDVEGLLSLMDENDIPAAAERGADIFSHPVGVLFFSLIDFLSDPSKVEALAETIAVGLWNLEFSKRAELIKSLRSGKTVDTIKAIPELLQLNNEAITSGVLNFIILAADLSGITRIAAQSPIGAEVWRGIFTLSLSIAAQNNIEDPRVLISELLAYRKSAEKRPIKIMSGKVNAPVTIMTAHGSKGLEFDYVFLPYAVEESWISRRHSSFFVMPREKEEGDEIRDERRLFYVALTRARKRLVISLSLEAGSTTFTPLRFIEELDKAHISHTDVPSFEKPIKPREKANLDAKRSSEKAEYAKRTLMENGLSVTALNHFIKCPNEFFYKSILKLPEPPTASSEKGNAMHEAMAALWHMPDRNESNITAAIEKVVKEFFEKSFLPKFEKEAIVDELILSAPHIATALRQHFAEVGAVSTESWVETEFSSTQMGEPVSLNLHGKLDALVESEKVIKVFDYKTRSGLSIAAIRGETKNDDRSYFRQLVFYKLLLQGNSKYQSKSVEPALVFLKPDEKGRCPIVSVPIESSDILNLKKEVEALIETVWSGRLLSAKCDDKNCKFCGFGNLI